MSGICGRGWADRCRTAMGPKCTCRCGGLNHGKGLSDEIRDLLNEKIEAQFTVVYDGPEALVLRDVGPWDANPTVTNDAANVVARVKGQLRGRRLFYFDSGNQLDELLVVDNVFVSFRAGAPADVRRALGMAVAA